MNRLAIVLVTTASAASADPTITTGADGELLPVVSNRYSGGLPGLPSETTTSGPVAYGVGGLVDWNAAPHVSIGFAPRYLLGIDPGTSASQLDLRVRLAVGTRVSQTLTIYAFAAPGDSILFLNSSPGRIATTHDALALELGAGAKLQATRSLAITGELGYQMTQSFGAVSVVGPGDLIDYSNNFLSFSLGFVTPVL